MLHNFVAGNIYQMGPGVGGAGVSGQGRPAGGAGGKMCKSQLILKATSCNNVNLK